MCSIALAAGMASFATGAAQTIATYQGQKQDAENVRQSALAAERQETLEITRRQMQEADATAQKKTLSDLDEAERIADAEVSAAAAGVSGISLDNLIGDISRRSARDQQTLTENARMTAQQLQLEKRSAGIRRQSRINSAPKPSALSLVAGLGSSALSGFSTYNKMMG